MSKRAHGPDENEIRRNVKARTSDYVGPAEGTGPLADLLPELRNVLYGHMDLVSLGRFASTCRGFYIELVSEPSHRLWLPQKWRSVFKVKVSSARRLTDDAVTGRMALQRVIEGIIRPSKLFEQVKNVSGLIELSVYSHSNARNVMIRLYDPRHKLRPWDRGRIYGAEYKVLHDGSLVPESKQLAANRIRIVEVAHELHLASGEKRSATRKKHSEIPVHLRRNLAAAEKEMRAHRVLANRFFHLKKNDRFLKNIPETLCAADEFKVTLHRIMALREDIIKIKNSISACGRPPSVGSAGPAASEEEESSD